MIETRPKWLQKEIKIINLRIPFGMLKRGANVSFRESFPIFSSGSDQATHVIVGKFEGFPLVTCKYGGFQNSGTPKWMVYMENPIEIMIWGYHHLRKHPYGAGVI